MKKGVNMTFKELVNMSRQDLLKVWIDAMDSGDTKLEELAMSAMAKTQKVFDGVKVKRGPQVGRTNIEESNADRSRRLNFIRSMK